MAPVADRVMADFNISAMVFGSLGAAYFYIYAAMQLPSGTLADTLGPRKTLTAGLLLSILGSLVMGLAPSFGVIYVGRLIVSFGVSVAWLSVVKVIMGWFWAREIATMTGLSVAVAHLGQIAAATPLALLVMWAGWRMSFVAIAGLSLVLVIAIWLILKDSPAQVGLPTIAEFERESAARGSRIGRLCESECSREVQDGGRQQTALATRAGRIGIIRLLFHPVSQLGGDLPDAGI